MAAPDKPEAEKRKHTVIWEPSEWELLERAAERLSADHALKLAPVDIIRSGAIRRAEEILGSPAAA